MRSSFLTFLLALFMSAISVQSFAATSTTSLSGNSGGSNFIASQRRSQHPAMGPVKRASSGAASLNMAGVAKFGVFSPAVYGSKIVLGEKKLKSVRGKAISLHSQAIGDFCGWVGATHLRVSIIKLAKENGNYLGFLV
mmetsp:Transcript_9209/g.11436  ORF Transcript_9209/g.11436 Transcript_9209/m.11436 type:complete len:138 (+) Transcript_9209:126-539(+)